MSTSTKVLTCFCLISFAFAQIIARPQSTFDSQELDIQQPAPQEYRSADLRKFYSPINEIPNYYDDDLMSRLQLQLLSAYARNLQAPSFGNSNQQRMPQVIDASKGMTEQKRHPRYRQCYFNPISCFRK